MACFILQHRSSAFSSSLLVTAASSNIRPRCYPSYSFFCRNRKLLTTRIRSWAESNPALARQVLTPPPPFLSSSSSSGIVWNLLAEMTSGDSTTLLEMYLQQRNWNIPCDLNREEAIGLVSYPLTFPLTLGFYYCSTMTSCHKSTAPIRICCIGARAEATLPDIFWKELLISTFPLSWDITFIGPDVGEKQRPMRIELDANHSTSTFLHLSFQNGYFDEYIIRATKNKNDQATLISNTWDGVILFNPGIGHPFLKKKWNTTMQLLLQEDVLLLMTAHNKIDCERDFQTFQNLQLQSPKRSTRTYSDAYIPNPWSSRMQVEDPLNTTQLVRANAYVLMSPIETSKGD